jgi:hypothetical protein
LTGLPGANRLYWVPRASAAARRSKCSFENAKLAKKRVEILANPDEPTTGDYMYGLYDKTHPLNGLKDEISRMRGALRGFGGKEVKLTVRGSRIDEETGTEKRFKYSEKFQLNNYRDVFGPGGAYSAVLRNVRQKGSDDVIVTHELIIEEL